MRHEYARVVSRFVCQPRRRRGESISPGRKPWVQIASGVSAEGAKEASFAPTGLGTIGHVHPGLTPWANALAAPSAQPCIVVMGQSPDGACRATHAPFLMPHAVLR